MQIKYKDNWLYCGPSAHKPTWIRNATTQQVAQHIKDHRSNYPQYWINQNQIDEQSQSSGSNTLDLKQQQPCKHLVTITVRGEWGPHRAKKICMDCNSWIKWEKANK